MEETSVDRGDPRNPPVVGEKAPEFRLLSLQGGGIGPQDYEGAHRVVVAFYPKDNTSG